MLFTEYTTSGPKVIHLCIFSIDSLQNAKKRDKLLSNFRSAIDKPLAPEVKPVNPEVEVVAVVAVAGPKRKIIGTIPFNLPIIL